MPDRYAVGRCAQHSVLTMKYCERCRAETERYADGRCAPCRRAWKRSDKARTANRARRARDPERFNAQQRALRARDPERFRARDRARSKAYKTQILVYDRRRRGLPEPPRPEPETCEVCGRWSLQALHLDHDHKSGAFRGWLCGNCNRAIGLVCDDPERLRKLAAYLEQFARSRLTLVAVNL